VQALKDMHLELRHGEVLAVVGENGAGKSTLMKLLTGVYTADEGHFAMNGHPLVVNGPKEALAAGLSIIHQEFNLMPHLTVAQNIAIGREPMLGGLFVDERRLNREAAELVERLGLPLDVRRKVGDLTVASQQMVEIAKALSHDAKVLIMDEPTAALNDAEVRVLHDLIRRFTREDTGVIYISHRMEELPAIADRVTVIRDGAYVATVDAATTSVEHVIALMVGRAIDTHATPRNVREDRETVLSVEGLSTKDLLHDVSFDLRRGEILGVAGLMGAGRTEVARAIVGADRTTAGVVRLNGRPLTIHNPADAAAHGIGYLSEDRKRYGLLLEQDVGQNIGLGSLAKRFTRFGFVDGQAVRARAAGLVRSLRIKTPSVAETTRNLSGGNQQKVVIAKWLLNDCDVLIFDEPTRGIDVGAKEEIYGLIDRLAADGKSIVMISSELPEILRMSHRVLVMSQGRVTAVLDRDEATQETVMHHATTKAGAR
jgi:ribose transport system ATP-binding protein